MNHDSAPSQKRRSLAGLVVTLAVTLVVSYALPAAQTATPSTGKKVLTVDDYTKWRSINGAEISGDGAVGDLRPVVHQHAAGRRQAGAAPAEPRRPTRTSRFPNATGGVVLGRLEVVRLPGRSWRRRGGRGGRGGPAVAAAAATAPAARRRRLPAGAAGRPGGAAHARHRRAERVELRNLATGAVRSWQDIQSFTFSADVDAPGAAPAAADAGGGAGGRARRPLIRRRAGGAGGRRGGGRRRRRDRRAARRRRHAAQPRDRPRSAARQRRRHRVQPRRRSARLHGRRGRQGHQRPVRARPSQRPHQRARQRREELQPAHVERRRHGAGRAQGPRRRQDARARQRAARVPQRAGGAERRRAGAGRARSGEGRRLSEGLGRQRPRGARLERRQQARLLRHEGAGRRARRGARARAPTRSPTSTSGTRPTSGSSRVQMIRADAGPQLHVPRGLRRRRRDRFVKLADADDARPRRVARTAAGPSAATRAATSRDYKRPAADIYRVNTTTGERTLMLQEPCSSAPAHVRHLAGRPLLPVLEGQQVPGLRPRRGDDQDARRRDHGELRRHGVRPPGSEALVRHRRLHDRRQGGHRAAALRPVAAAARRIGAAATSRTARARRTRSGSGTCGPSRDPAGGRPGGPAGADAAAAARRGTIDLSKPMTLSAYGEYTKKAGFYELAGGQLKEIVYEDASFSNPTKAAKADKFLFTRQTFVEFPDLRVSGPGLQGLEEDHRRQSAAGGVPLGPSHPVRLQEQGRPSGSRASSRCPTTTSPARSGRCS